MKLVTRLVLSGAVAAAAFGLTPPASACDQPPKCASCRLHPLEVLEGGKPFSCYS